MRTDLPGRRHLQNWQTPMSSPMNSIVWPLALLIYNSVIKVSDKINLSPPHLCQACDMVPVLLYMPYLITHIWACLHAHSFTKTVIPSSSVNCESSAVDAKTLDGCQTDLERWKTLTDVVTGTLMLLHCDNARFFVFRRQLLSDTSIVRIKMSVFPVKYGFSVCWIIAQSELIGSSHVFSALNENIRQNSLTRVDFHGKPSRLAKIHKNIAFCWLFAIYTQHLHTPQVHDCIICCMS